MFSKVKQAVKRFVACKAGLETVEYAIITGLVVAATIGVIAAIGAWVLTQFQTVQSSLGA